jgi:hypothetical protein
VVIVFGGVSLFFKFFKAIFLSMSRHYIHLHIYFP